MKSLNHKLRLASQLSPVDRLIFLESWGSVLGFWLALRWKSFDSLSESQFLIPSKKVVKSASLDFGQHVYKLLGWAAQVHIFPMTCLEKSLALNWMLKRRGIQTQVKIGAQKVSAGIAAHAWVEMNDQVVGEAESVASNFKVLKPTFPSTSKGA